MDTFLDVIRRNLTGDLEYIKIIQKKSERKAALHVAKLFLTTVFLSVFAFGISNRESLNNTFTASLISGTFGVVSVISNRVFEKIAHNIPKDNKFKNKFKAVFVTTVSTLVTAAVITIFREKTAIMDVFFIYFPTITVLSCVEVISSKIRSRGIFFRATKNE